MRGEAYKKEKRVVEASKEEEEDEKGKRRRRRRRGVDRSEHVLRHSSVCCHGAGSVRAAQ